MEASLDVLVLEEKSEAFCLRNKVVFYSRSSRRTKRKHETVITKIKVVENPPP